jgi:hypothetical protein
MGAAIGCKGHDQGDLVLDRESNTSTQTMLFRYDHHGSEGYLGNID